MKMKPLGLERKLFERPDKHRGGDCRCGRRHQTARLYFGYGACVFCGLLTPYKVPSKVETDHMANLRKGPVEYTPRERAVGFIRIWVGAENGRKLRGEFEELGEEKWREAALFAYGVTMKRVLRKVGLGEAFLGIPSIKDASAELLQEAILCSGKY